MLLILLVTEADTFGLLKTLLHRPDYISQTEKQFTKERGVLRDLHKKFNVSSKVDCN